MIQLAFPLTPLQEGMLYHSIREPNSGLYHGQCVAVLRGELSPSLFQQAWNLAAERHAVLRTFFAWEKRDRPLQVVRERVALEVDFLDWQHESTEECNRKWNALLASDRTHGFDLASAPLMRLVVARTGSAEHRLLWAIHHALVDGWSGLLVLREVVEDHNTLLAGQTPARGIAATFDQFVGWVQSQSAAADEAYWRRALNGFEGGQRLPGAGSVELGNHGIANRAEAHRDYTTRTLSETETAKLQSIAAHFRVTPNTLLMGAWAVMLARHAATDEVMFGVTVSERPAIIPSVERAAGLYLGTVPLRANASSEKSVAEWLRELQLALSDAREHGAPGLAAIQRYSDIPAGAPLIESLVVFENFPADVVQPIARGATNGDAPQALIVAEAELIGPSNLPLVLLAVPRTAPRKELSLTLITDPTVIAARVASDLLDQLSKLLFSYEVLAQSPASELSVMTSEEATLVEQWSKSAAPAPAPVDVLDAFDACVARNSAAIALQTDTQEVSYATLNRAANRLANRIRASGVEAGSLIGILAERSPACITAMLAVLKANCAYVPLDPNTPVAHLTHVAGRLDAIFANAATTTRHSALHGRMLLLDEADEQSSEPPPRTSSSNAPAYVIYTSGSTGTPKGVVVERGHLAASNAARASYYNEPPRCFLLLSSPTVDSSVAGIFWTLCAGGTLVLPPARVEQDIEGLTQLIQQTSVTHTLLVPSLYRTLLELADMKRLASLRCVVVAGESCSADVVQLHRERMSRAELHNEYGPSEATVWATADNLTRSPSETVTIGRPVPGARVHLLDNRLRPVPVGACGEICIGGAFVARGYLDNAAETARKFVQNPFGDGRLYRTGDIGRYQSDGRIEFLGRADDQLKVRGFRVEPEEIERAVLQFAGVKDAAVVLHTGENAVATVNEDLISALLARSDEEIDQLFASLGELS